MDTKMLLKDMNHLSQLIHEVILPSLDEEKVATASYYLGSLSNNLDDIIFEVEKYNTGGEDEVKKKS
jgi:hypothetical protein